MNIWDMKKTAFGVKTARNSRNGYGKKTIKSKWEESEIEVPRDREGTFEPKIISKRQTRTDDIEARILAMCQTEMSVYGIEDHIRDITEWKTQQA